MLGKDLLEKIKQVTSQILFSSQAETFATEKLKDSEEQVKYSELVVGSPVFKSSASGDVALEDGEYILDSGISFKVADGLISEVLEASEESEELAEDKDEESKDEAKDENKEEEKLNAGNSELLQKIEALEAELALIKEALKPQDFTKEEAFTKLDNDVKAIAELLNAIAKTPVEFSKSDNRIEATDAKNDRLKHLADIISNKN
jgi:hypothetical protein